MQVFDLQPKEKGFISKTAHGCELDGWDGVQALRAPSSAERPRLSEHGHFFVVQKCCSYGHGVFSERTGYFYGIIYTFKCFFLVLITGIARALTVVKSGFLGGEVMVNYLLVMTNGSLLKIPHLVR